LALSPTGFACVAGRRATRVGRLRCGEIGAAAKRSQSPPPLCARRAAFRASFAHNRAKSGAAAIHSALLATFSPKRWNRVF